MTTTADSDGPRAIRSATRARASARAAALFAIAVTVGVAAGPTRAAPAPAPERTVGLLPLRGADTPDVRDLDAGLRRAMDALPATSLLGEPATRQALAAAAALGPCDVQTLDCLLRAGALAGLDVLVSAEVQRGADGVVVELRRVDVVAGIERDRVRVPLGDPKVRARDVKALATAALDEGRYRGALAVIVRPAGATVTVDGLSRGTAPLAGPIDLLPGPHDVFVARAGSESQQTRVDVVFGETTRIAFDLKPGTSSLPVPVRATASPPPAPPTVATAAEPPRRALRIAVYELARTGVDERVGVVVQESLLLELRKLQRCSVVGMDEIRAMLDHEATKQMLGCADESCLAEIADAVGADVLVIGSLARVGDEHVFGLRRIDMGTQQVAGSYSQRVVAQDGVELLALVGPAVLATFADLPLRPGAVRGVADEMFIRLHPPPFAPWLFWTTAVTTGVVAASTIAAGAGYVVAQTTWAQKASSGTAAKPVDGRGLSELEDVVTGTAIATWVFLGATVLGAAASGAVFAFTDWRGDDEVNE